MAGGHRVAASEMICAAANPADARALDSGGPLLSDGQVVGLVSWGEGSIRPDAPSVFSRVRVDF